MEFLVIYAKLIASFADKYRWGETEPALFVSEFTINSVNHNATSTAPLLKPGTKNLACQQEHKLLNRFVSLGQRNRISFSNTLDWFKKKNLFSGYSRGGISTSRPFAGA